MSSQRRHGSPHIPILAIVSLAICYPVAAQVKFTRQPDRISVEIDGQPFGDLFLAADGNKPYLYPLRSPQGIVVTRHFPMEPVPGESSDHPHHRGMFFSHGDISGTNFWATEASDKAVNKGRMVLKKVIELKGGTKEGTIKVAFDGLNPKGQPMMTETRTLTFYTGHQSRILDFQIDILALQQLKFGDTKEGTFGIRLADFLAEDRGGTLVNAQGEQTEKQVWGKRSNWVDNFGTVDGQVVGVAVMDHPTNPRHPTYWHARAYGLLAANPFGAHDFERDKSEDGGLTVPAGSSVRFRYRVVIHTGDSESAGIASMYRDYVSSK